MFFLETFAVVGLVIAAIIVAVAVYDLVTWLISLWVVYRLGRTDDFEPIGPDAPPPPHVSPFASPRTRSETSPQVTAEGEVKI